MTRLKWMLICLVLINAAACGSHSDIVKIDLVSHSGQFEFISDDPYMDSTTSILYKAANPLCQELGSTHGPGFPTLNRRQYRVDRKFDGSTMMVAKSEPGRALCNYELVEIGTTISVNGVGSGNIHIMATDDGPAEIDIYCHEPILDERDFSCRKKDGMYNGTGEGMEHICGYAVCLQLNLESDALKIHAYLEPWRPDKDPDRSEIPWQKKYGQRTNRGI